MTWKLRTETDMETGEGARYFANEETGTIVPEGEALLLVKQIIKNFPEAVDALVGELNAEARLGGEVAAPVPQFPPEEEEEGGWVPDQFQQPQQPQEPVAPEPQIPQVPMMQQPQQAVMQPRGAQEEPAHQPLNIPKNLSKPSGGVSLKDFAPASGGRERDTGQL